MPSSHQLLEHAPQEGIAELHASRFGRQGLVQRSRIRGDVASWMADSSRVADATSCIDGAESVARAIHLAGPRGIPCDQFPVDSEALLESLATEFVIVLDTGEERSWCPLTDLTSEILDRWRGDMPARQRPQGRKAGARAFLEGVATLSAAIDSGRARLNRDGTLNRRDRPLLRERFVHVAPLGESALEHALDTALGLLSELGFLRQRDGRLEVADGLDDWLAAADADPSAAIHWWLRSVPRLAGLDHDLAAFAVSGLPGRAAVELFLRRESSLRDPVDSTRWSDLPGLLREAVSIGFIETEVVNGSLAHAWPRLRPAPSRSERPWWCTSDFQLFLSPDAPLALHRAAEFMGVRESAELVCRYRIVRESILAGAAAPGWGARLPHLIEQLAPPRSVAFQLEEWLASRRACVFDSVRILKVPDTRRHSELASLDTFCSLVREVVPGWGFVIEPDNEPALRKLLATLGYDPPQDPATSAAEPWHPPDAAPALAALPYEPDWQWPRIGSSARRASAGSSSRYASGTPKELEFHDVLRLVEYAALTECEIDVVLKGQSQKVLRVRAERVDRRKEPATLEARLCSTGERRDLAIDSIRKIAIVGE